MFFSFLILTESSYEDGYIKVMTITPRQTWPTNSPSWPPTFSPFPKIFNQPIDSAFFTTTRKISLIFVIACCAIILVLILLICRLNHKPKRYFSGNDNSEIDLMD